MIGIALAGLASVVLLLLGMRRMSTLPTATRGLRQLLSGVSLALLATLAATLPAMLPDGSGWPPLVAVALGASLAVGSGRLVGSDITGRIALFNAFGALAALCLGTVELLHAGEHAGLSRAAAVLCVLFGAIATSGSLLVTLRRRGSAPAERVQPAQGLYVGLVVLVILLGLVLAFSPDASIGLLLPFILLALGTGIAVALPIEREDLPILVSSFNVFIGLAVVLDGLVLAHGPMIVAGALVLAAGMRTTRLMARAANRRLSEILYSGFGIRDVDAPFADPSSGWHVVGANDAAVQIACSRELLIVPGYGAALAQAQHKLRELVHLLDERGIVWHFGIHPVAGRMPGHLDVLLAEAGVPMDRLLDLDAANARIGTCDIVLVVGASDIVNPLARHDPDSPLHGMPIIDAARAERVFVIEQAAGIGYAGERNALLAEPASRVLRGDALEVLRALIEEIRLVA